MAREIRPMPSAVRLREDDSAAALQALAEATVSPLMSGAKSKATST
jgi:hypothetical protein